MLERAAGRRWHVLPAFLPAAALLAPAARDLFGIAPPDYMEGKCVLRVA